MSKKTDSGISADVRKFLRDAAKGGEQRHLLTNVFVHLRGAQQHMQVTHLVFQAA